MATPANNPASSNPTPPGPSPLSRRRIRIGLTLALVGFLVFLLGARPSLFHLDRSQAIGFIQIAVMLVGLAFICISGYLTLASFWKPGTHSIAADIGLRLVTTGYLICVFAGMADVFGIGSHSFPQVPYFGPLQALGVELGELIIATGLMLLIPYTQNRHDASEKNPHP